MASYLIKDTTREEREQIVAEAIGNISADEPAPKIASSSCGLMTASTSFSPKPGKSTPMSLETAFVSVLQ